MHEHVLHNHVVQWCVIHLNHLLALELKIQL